MAKPTTGSDPLADTAAAGNPALDATLTNATTAPTARAPGELPKTIGRYAIDGLLGEGGMGIVYAAHDPDLDRKIALKVLQGVGSEPARARLLREARAMAKLSHPAVVTVHEVGTANGVDYVAMELVDGTTLGEWITTAKPPLVELLAAFESAGRGLAAAHAAGLVHRDFKPHNVLRSRRGRVVVTDFGLARASLDDSAEVPARPSHREVRDTGSLASTLTATGAVLGTPAYMAPEQHDGTAIGPAADQFAYCVALWEALAGERPFTGQNLGELRAAIDRGPSGEAKIPRALRAPLRRGLSVRPDARFSSMDDLLAALHRDRKRKRAWTIAAACGVACAAGLYLARSPEPPSPPAAPPALAGCVADELAGFTNAPGRAKLVTTPTGKRLVGYLDALASDWTDAQAAICTHPEDPEHARRASCLHVVARELERALAGLAALTPEEIADADAGLSVGDPRACNAKPRPPTRIVIDDAAAVAISAAANGNVARRRALVEPPATAPCLRALYFLTRLRDWPILPFTQTTTYKAALVEAADRCGDDRIGASATALSVSTNLDEMIQDPTATSRVDAAIARSGGDRSLAILRELVDGLQARYRNDHDAAIAHLDKATEMGIQRGIRQIAAITAGMTVELLARRAGPGDLDRAESLLQRAIEIVDEHHRGALQRQLFLVQFGRGKTADAMRAAAAIVDPTGGQGYEPRAPVPTIAVAGRVLDETGKPVAGARVVAGRRVVIYGDALDPVAPRALAAVTAADGTFALAEVPRDALVIADHTLPAPAAPKVELRRHATAAIAGSIRATTGDVGRIDVGIVLDGTGEQLMYTTAITADHTWHVDHVPTGKAMVVVEYGVDRRQRRQVPVVIGPTTAPVALEVAMRGEPLHVMVRNQVEVPLSMGFVWVVRGKYTGKLVRDVEKLGVAAASARALPVRPENAPARVRGDLRSGDVVTRLSAIEPGEISVCAIGASGNFADADFQQRFDKHSDELPLTCVPATMGGSEQVVLVQVPPMKRLD